MTRQFNLICWLAVHNPLNVSVIGPVLVAPNCICKSLLCDYNGEEVPCSNIHYLVTILDGENICAVFKVRNGLFPLHFWVNVVAQILALAEKLSLLRQDESVGATCDDFLETFTVLWLFDL